MDKAGLEVDIVAERKDSDIYMPRLRNLGVGFRVLSGSTRKVYKNLKAFKDLIRERKYDVLHLNIYQGLSLLYVKEAKKAGIPVRLVHAHGAGLRPGATYMLKLCLHLVSKHVLYKDVTASLACSGKAAAFMFPEGINYRFIPNGIDIPSFICDSEIRKKVRQKLNIEDHYVIGNVGRLSSEKNQGFLLDVLVRVRMKCPEAVLLLVGDGEERAHLEEKAKQLKIEDKVIFYGLSDHVPQLLWAMDIFVLPSRVEGFGITAIEAQAAGLPVLCSTGVPDEACVTESARRLPLRPETWADQILASRNTARRETSDTLMQAGYDIKSVAETIRSLFTMGA